MKIISVYSLKGGSGKTTISLLLVQSLQKRGYKVCLLDSDAHQQSALNWSKTNKVDCFGIDKSLTPADLKQLEKRNFDYVVIDGTPVTNNYSANILFLSDLVIIPVPPTQLSFSSFLQKNHQAVLRQVKDKGTKLWVVINGVTMHNRDDVASIQDYLDSDKMDVDDVYHLGHRKAFVIDYTKSFYDKKNPKAIHELEYMVDGLGVRPAR